MERRNFLRLLGLSAAGLLAPDLTLDPERLLWVPGAKTIFLPSPVGFEFRYTDWIAADTLRILKNKLTLASHFNRQFDEQFHVGATIQVKRPARYAVGV